MVIFYVDTFTYGYGQGYFHLFRTVFRPDKALKTIIKITIGELILLF